MTASVFVTIVTTIAARRAASAAVSATSAPRSLRSRVASGVRFHTIVGMPARNALIAMPCPIAPMPSTATGACVPAMGLCLLRREHPAMLLEASGDPDEEVLTDQVEPVRAVEAPAGPPDDLVETRDDRGHCLAAFDEARRQ